MVGPDQLHGFFGNSFFLIRIPGLAEGIGHGRHLLFFQDPDPAVRADRQSGPCQLVETPPDRGFAGTVSRTGIRGRDLAQVLQIDHQLLQPVSFHGGFLLVLHSLYHQKRSKSMTGIPKNSHKNRFYLKKMIVWQKK